MEHSPLITLTTDFGYLELFVNSGNAASDFDVTVGEKVGVILT